MKILKLSKTLSSLQLLLPGLILKIIVILAVDLNHLQHNGIIASEEENYQIRQKMHSSHKLSGEQKPDFTIKERMTPNRINLEEAIGSQKNYTVGIDCGDSHHACSDEKTCCPLEFKCCASHSSDGMMSCCPAGLDVSFFIKQSKSTVEHF